MTTTVDRIDNGDGTHTLLVDFVQVAVVQESDTEIAQAVWNTCRRLERVDERETTRPAPPAEDPR